MKKITAFLLLAFLVLSSHTAWSLGANDRLWVLATDALGASPTLYAFDASGNEVDPNIGTPQLPVPASQTSGHYLVAGDSVIYKLDANLQAVPFNSDFSASGIESYALAVDTADNVYVASNLGQGIQIWRVDASGVSHAFSSTTFAGVYGLSITVSGTGSGINQPPVVNAGPDLVVSLPMALVTLNGSVTDDALLNQTPAVAWSKVSGLGNPIFLNYDQAVTNARFFSADTYVLELDADDGEHVAGDTVTVVVNPPLVGNIVASSGRNYTLDSLLVNKRCYIDRTYFFTSVPPHLVGATYIKTAMDDRLLKQPANFLTFTLDRDATVYIAYDNRFSVIPAWIDGTWTLEPDLVGVNGGLNRRLYSKAFPAGSVVLGPNLQNPASGGRHMYNVILTEEVIITPPGGGGD